MPCEWADPSIAYFDGTYYAFTAGSMIESTDLQTWSSNNVVGNSRHFLSRTPSWAGNWGGAPGAPIKHPDGYYVMTFSEIISGNYAGSSKVGTSSYCVGTAYARTPSGPYTPQNDPITCGDIKETNIGAIDPTLRLIDGEVYIYWKSQGVLSLWGAKLKGSAWSLTIDDATSTNLLNTTSGRSWESEPGAGCIEAPATLHYNNQTWLFYSGGAWGNPLRETPYSIGYAACDTPLGPCRKISEKAPWYGPEMPSGAVSPGGQDFFHDAAGKPWMVFHAFADNNHTATTHGSRTMRILPLFEGDYLPNITMTDPYDVKKREERAKLIASGAIKCDDSCGGGNAENGICQDGGQGSECSPAGGWDREGHMCPPNGIRSFCAWGTDCSDCNYRYA